MGCVDTITYNKFPKQKDKNYKYPQFKIGSRVKVCYHYDTSKYHYGTIVRDDLEEPFETIIKLDNGRYLRSTECQFSYVDEENTSDDVCEWEKDSIGNYGYAVYYSKCFTKTPNGFGIEPDIVGDWKYCPYCGKKIKMVK